MERIISWQLPDGYYAYMGQNWKQHIRSSMLSTEELSEVGKKVAQYTDDEYVEEYAQLVSEVNEKFPGIEMPGLTEDTKSNTAILTLDSEGLVTKENIDSLFEDKPTDLVNKYKEAINTYVSGKVTDLKDILSSSKEEIQNIKTNVLENKAAMKTGVERAVNIAKESAENIAKVGTQLKSFNPVRDWYQKNYDLSKEGVDALFNGLKDELSELREENKALRELMNTFATKAELSDRIKDIRSIESGDFGIKVDEDGIWLKINNPEEYRRLCVDEYEKLLIK